MNALVVPWLSVLGSGSLALEICGFWYILGSCSLQAMALGPWLLHPWSLVPWALWPSDLIMHMPARAPCEVCGPCMHVCMGWEWGQVGI